MAVRRSVSWLSLWLFLMGLAGCLSRANSYFVGIDAHGSECFYDRVSSGMKLSLTFEVVEGGFLDIDVSVRLWLK